MSQLETLLPPTAFPSPPLTHTEYHPIRLAPSHPETIFPSLPPLHIGHPDLHLREGIIAAERRVAAGEADAEKAFFVADLSVVYRQHMRWLRLLPDVQPFYAVKCNPDPYILRLLASLGAGFDCASISEIQSVLSLHPSFPPSSIIYANPTKAASFIRNAARVGVDTMTFDNTDELYKIKRVHPQAKLVLRILTDDSKSLCAFGVKFGAALAVVPSLLAKARELELDVIGVSFHVGSGCYDPSVYTSAVQRAHSVFTMAREYGYKFTLLDLGGGFEDSLFEDAARYLNDALAEWFPREWREREGVKVIAEPGRYYVSQTFRLACCVIARRVPEEDGEGEDPPESEAKKEDGEGKEEMPKIMYYINDGIYGSFNCILFDHQVPLPVPLSLSGSFHTPSPSSSLVKASIWGPTCDSIDCISRGVYLPKMNVGDWMGFEGMGAYTLCAASRFNGFEVSRVVYTAGGGAEEGEVRGVLRGWREGGGV